ncbi:hypothetical protein HS1genome_1389 [Sulfodiicoccus acidiphilus]|uniref:Uncharacterized protein n=1 Tax=Sulfodiicoccus acidiphilus TaxID=1670455 RepID=A0A348B498_9CREN|nr:hypothetical protein HS1genome_1389 [Sulfodiicoccus acidiphilus]GGU04599.1 hypothetical protein GCM10007116_21530 [Sulfodiicoccus acidiphilus]
MSVGEFAIINAVILILLGLGGYAFLKYVVKPTEGVKEDE